MRLSTSLELALAAGWFFAPGVHSLPQSQQKRRASSIKFRSAPRTRAEGTAPKYNVFAATGKTDIDLTSSQDLIYIADVTVAGHDYPVQLDTGSSDLWIQTDSGLTGTTFTEFNLKLTYGTGYADGSVVRGKVDFAGFTVDDQACLDAIMAENPVLNLGAKGILGLGFTRLSNIDSTVNQTGQSWGRSLLYNIFSQDSSVPNFVTFLLTRSNDPEAPQEGSFTISETEDSYSAVTNQPRINTWPVNAPARWNILLDSFIVGNKKFSVGTTVKGVSGGKAVILLDSGTSFTYAPDTVVNALYRGLTGASLNNKLGQWTLPCDTRIEVTLTIGGQAYNLHPLDMVVRSTVDKSVCVGTFIPMSTPIAAGEFDWLVGANVLRSFYTLYDFGDPVHNAPEGNSPTVQLMQLRTAAESAQDFFKIRGGDPPTTTNSTDNTGNNNSSEPEDGGSTVTDDQSTDGSGGKGAGSTGGSSSGSSDPTVGSNISASIRTSIQKVVDYMPAVLGILGVNVAIFVLLLIGGIIWVVRKRKSARRGPIALGGGSGDYKAVATTEAGSMRQRGGLPNTPLTPTTPTHQDGLIAGQAPAPQYDSSSLPMRRGMLRPAPIDVGDARHSSAY
ncbi:acid protease [Auriculariales sp. MPI-PUGE-AT-0066]|nr:acid protease [Auriculariales sp. MPI-PUGE-AT-0066]